MVEVDIHCNVIRCRKPMALETQACVTSCSHIFCVSCANSIFSKALLCPACNSSLSDSDDIILTQLNPTEEYKSSVLAGLKPDVILDISTRAIAFYEYQTSQEIYYRTIMQKKLEDRYNTLKDQFDIATRDLNHIIKVEKEKQIALMKEFELEKVKSQQALAKLDEKSKQFQKLQTMYEKLKRKAITPNMQESFMSPQQQPMLPALPYRSNNLVRMNQQQQTVIVDDDVISRLGRSSTVARSIYIPQRQQEPSSTRLPSPVKSVYRPRQQNHRHSHHEDRHTYYSHYHKVPTATPAPPREYIQREQYPTAHHQQKYKTRRLTNNTESN